MKNEFCCNYGMINIIEEVEETISRYEDEGYIESEHKILMVSDNKFYFRDKHDNSVEIIDYFDRERNIKDEIKMIQCIETAIEYGTCINK